MRLGLTGILATALVAASTSAMAARSPADVVGKWSAHQNCKNGADFAYVMQGGKLERIVRDGKRSYRTPVKIQIDGRNLRIQMDEKVYTFRLQTPDAMQALKYTDSRTGLAANLAPRTWFRCS